MQCLCFELQKNMLKITFTKYNMQDNTLINNFNKTQNTKKMFTKS